MSRDDGPIAIPKLAIRNARLAPDPDQQPSVRSPTLRQGVRPLRLVDNDRHRACRLALPPNTEPRDADAAAVTATAAVDGADSAAAGGSGEMDGFDPLTALLVGLGLGGVAVVGFRRLRTGDERPVPRAHTEEPGD